MSKTENSIMGLLAAYRKMFGYIRQDNPEIRDKESIIKEAEVALARAEKANIWSWRMPVQPDSSYFGILGKHYDFHLKVESVKQRKYGYRLECLDQRGRTYILRAQLSRVKFSIEPGQNLFFRAQVISKRSLLGKKFTRLNVTSDLHKV